MDVLDWWDRMEPSNVLALLSAFGLRLLPASRLGFFLAWWGSCLTYYNEQSPRSGLNHLRWHSAGQYLVIQDVLFACALVSSAGAEIPAVLAVPSSWEICSFRDISWDYIWSGLVVSRILSFSSDGLISSVFRRSFFPFCCNASRALKL